MVRLLVSPTHSVDILQLLLSNLWAISGHTNYCFARLALSNICFVVFLSLRNTPIAYLTAWSYERRKFLHGIAGLTSVAHAVIHGACYSSFFIQQNNAIRLQVMDEIYGIVAGFMLLSMAIFAIIFSRKHYELFYVLHVLFFILSVVFIGLHHPDAAENVVYAVAVAGGM